MAIVVTMSVPKDASRMELKDFETLSFEEQELMAVRFNSRVRTDDHTFEAILARACGNAGPKLVDAPEQVEAAPSLHGLKGRTP